MGKDHLKGRIGCLMKQWVLAPAGNHSRSSDMINSQWNGSGWRIECDEAEEDDPNLESSLCLLSQRLFPHCQLPIISCISLYALQQKFRQYLRGLLTSPIHKFSKCFFTENYFHTPVISITCVQTSFSEKAANLYLFQLCLNGIWAMLQQLRQQ